MTNENQWQMNRAGVVNFWYYDEETFHFSDGKLLLRGSNGSGKSVTMQSFLPVLLDGRKSPDRLDPFGSKARKMDDYLLGEKDVTGRDERTGYLFIEYKRKTTNQYITTGIGLRAKRHKQMDFWGFVITDNRRVGRDFSLYKEEGQGSNTQKIPLTRKELEAGIGEGGKVVQTQKEYMALVNKHVFGFESVEAYDELIKLLIQLRSPKLSKDFKPTVIYGILEDSLPELVDEELRPLSDTIENMDQTKQQLEQLERDQESLERLCNQYHSYNEFLLAEKATEFVKASQVVKKKTEEEKTIRQLLTEMETKKETLIKEEEVLKQEKDVFGETMKQLENHEVFDAEKEKLHVEEKIALLKKEESTKESLIDGKEKKERELKETYQKQADEKAQLEEDIKSLLEELKVFALEASYEEHKVNAEDFLRHIEKGFDFTVWRKETRAYAATINQIKNTWLVYNKEKGRYEDASREHGESQKRLDGLRDEAAKWQRLFEEEKEKLYSHMIRWLDQNPLFVTKDDQRQQLSHQIYELYEPYSFDDIKAAYSNRFQEYQRVFGEEKLDFLHEVKLLEEEIHSKELELDSWNNQREPEPDQHPQTKANRLRLKEENVQFVPFYQAVEFRAGVSEEDRERIESALSVSGLLDALIVRKSGKVQAIKHDKIIHSLPQQDRDKTLLSMLEPDLPEDCLLSKQEIEEVLLSIQVEGKMEAFSNGVGIDGHYTIGLLNGHAPVHDRAQYIGRQARQRYRQQQIEKLQSEISHLHNEKQKLLSKIEEIQAKLVKLVEAMNQFPKDSDVKEAFNSLHQSRQSISYMEKEVEVKNQKMKQIFSQWEKIRIELNTLSKGINLEFSELSYQAAFESMDFYQSELNQLEIQYTKMVEKHKNLLNLKDNLEGISEDILHMKGEQNIIIDQLKKHQLKVEQLEKQLVQLGAEDIRRQIKEVTSSLAKINQRLPELVRLFATNESEMKQMYKNVDSVSIDLEALREIYLLWEGVFIEELKLGLVQSDEEIKAEETILQAKQLQKQYAELVKKETRASVTDKLIKTFYREQQTLVEYRLTEEKIQTELNFTEDVKRSDEIQMKYHSLFEKSDRTSLIMEFKGQRVSPYLVLKELKDDILVQKEVLNDTDRELYEEIILNNVGRIIRARIQRAERWVKKINDLMEKRDTSSGLTFSIKWRPKTAEAEEEMDTKDLVDLLRSDPRLLKLEDMQRVTTHFRSKITRARDLSLSEGYGTTLHQVIKEILDYRRWFTFTLYFKREGEAKKELTNHVFFTFSGGEKAMAMYIPLFSAAYSRYQEADENAPYIISLDEAFAGVDENNIRDMFELVEELEFNYIMNSQALWGDYDTVSNLSICELVRPKNAPFVTVIRYLWNGTNKRLLLDEVESEAILKV
ncbi:TIGR02680 family protein [Metabacillus arenae]|uniref:TIGR02680 family protein n=1 Tax=Metabacillus arenae TaxID=2771434 RepID=A0A926NGC7_9BACI|nr:TIGR02680 family protein [Metabacillus arenae]MBD1379523.1 TIGR02680 family protein [Metabacillus arenae]